MGNNTVIGQIQKVLSSPSSIGLPGSSFWYFQGTVREGML
jgi:hypothetical protein